MERDFGTEIDALRQGQEDLNNKLTALLARCGATPTDGANPSDPRRTAPPEEGAIGFNKIHPMRNMHPDDRLSSLMLDLCKMADDGSMTGLITYLGVFSSGDRQSNWIRHTVDTDSLLALIEDRKAEHVLSCIGSNDRLNMILTLLRQPMTVAGLVENCGYNSTGQVYHHLKPLIAADIISEVEQGERGVYAVKFHRVQGIIMLLAGLADLLDPKYTQGCYHE